MHNHGWLTASKTGTHTIALCVPATGTWIDRLSRVCSARVQVIRDATVVTDGNDVLIEGYAYKAGDTPDWSVAPYRDRKAGYRINVETTMDNVAYMDDCTTQMLVYRRTRQFPTFA